MPFMKKFLIPIIYIALIFTAFHAVCASSQTDSAGYNLWLDYRPVQQPARQNEYEKRCSCITLPANKYQTVITKELTRAFEQLLGISPKWSENKQAGIHMSLDGDPAELGAEGYTIQSNSTGIAVQAAGDAGLLYAAFRLIREMQCGNSLERLMIKEVPAYDLRILNHWDDLDGHIERGYAGTSLWKWNELPETLDPRYEDYARANASIGINGVVLNNVNADPRILRRDYLKKVAALADVFRGYNIRVYLTANFAAPMKPSATPDVMKAWGGNLDTADPRDPQVQAWWKAKADEIYALIPDFGGFLVKANSEGMPGPQDYGCNHADGANLLARALKPHGGIVMWRTFVYNPEIDKDRMKRSYLEFMPLDGLFDDNVILQTKNGPLDFQPSEPIQPLFGAMRRSQMMLELQITQEYTGHSTYLVYLLPMWRAVLDFDTCCLGPGSTVARITEGKIYPQRIRAIAGVANTGNVRNWTEHPFAQANWYAFGRLAWNPEAPTVQITRDWIRATWHTDETATREIEAMMMPTWKVFTQSSSPYGLGLTLDVQNHYYANFRNRAGKEWFVDTTGVGMDRTSLGTNFTAQYFEPNRTRFEDPAQCPEMWLLSYHFLPWEYRMPSGKTLREALLEGLHAGPDLARQNIARWKSLRRKLDEERYQRVLRKLMQEFEDAARFRDQAVGFFSEFLE